jgi:hypothetical protein
MASNTIPHTHNINIHKHTCHQLQTRDAAILGQINGANALQIPGPEHSNLSARQAAKQDASLLVEGQALNTIDNNDQNRIQI